MARLRVVAEAAAILAAVAVVAAAAAAVPKPAAPLVLFVSADPESDSDYCEDCAIEVVGPDGRGRRRLAAGDEAAWSPDGTRVAYHAGSAVFVIRPDGTGRRRIGVGSGAVWSPDGRRLAFSRSGRLTIARADGSGLREVGLGRPAAWSPDGRRVAVVRGANYDGYGAVAVLEADGSGSRELGAGAAPAWSPDGSRLAFVNSSNQLMLVASDDDAAPAPTGIDYNCDPRVHPLLCGVSEFAWSPNGRNIAVVLSLPNPNYSDMLELVDVEAGTARELPAAPPLTPVWAPDSSAIVAARARINTSCGYNIGCDADGMPAWPRAQQLEKDGLYATGADGEGARRVTKGLDHTPAWSPDGAQIAFLRQEEPYRDVLPALYTVGADGGCPTRIAAGPAGIPVKLVGWRPQAAKLPPRHCADAVLDAANTSFWDASHVLLGGPFVLLFRIENDGDRPTRASLTVRAPAGFRYAPTRNCRSTNATTRCEFGKISAGGRVDLRLKGTVAISAAQKHFGRYDTPIRWLTTTATLRATGDLDLSSNTIEVWTNLVPCTREGTARGEVVTGTSGADWLCAREGDDVVSGLGGDDVIDAGLGNDVIDPGPGRDLVRARGGDDVVSAADGERDVIACGSGNDIVDADAADVVDAKTCETVTRH